MARDLANPEKGLLHPFFTIDMPPLMGVMSALLIAFILGIGTVSYTHLPGGALQ